MKSIRLYFKYVSAVLTSTMQYKLSFLLMCIGRFIVAFSGFIGISFLFSGFTGIKNYSYGEVLLCFSIVQAAFSLSECLFSGFKGFSGLVKRGDFDRMLLRPRSLILQVIGSRFELGRIGPLLTAGITLIVGIRTCELHFNIMRITTMILMILGGMVLFSALFLLGATINFFSIEDGGIINVLTYGGKDHGKYPIDIYGEGLKKFCTYLIPYTLFQYYPLQYLLGKTDNAIYGFFPLGTIVFLGMCYAFWRFGVRNYKSCGN
ncbi:MAG: hypothetical protein E7287_06360 [Lachnospiraceae bacterium]|nr:hypothetical protein [Lachnospiraceae bacterium]